MSTTTTIRLHRVLRAPAERIYRAFLDAAALSKWLPPHGFTGTVHEMDTQVGGGYLDLVPHERLSYTAVFDAALNLLAQLVEPEIRR